MAKSIIIALSVVFLLWAGVVAYASSYLVITNWCHFVNWRREPREMRVKMALWLAVPGMKVWLVWNRAVVLATIIAATPDTLSATPFIVAQSMFALPFVLIALALMLWWVFDQRYGAELGDRMWWRLILVGMGLGGATWIACWWL